MHVPSIPLKADGAQKSQGWLQDMCYPVLAKIGAAEENVERAISHLLRDRPELFKDGYIGPINAALTPAIQSMTGYLERLRNDWETFIPARYAALKAYVSRTFINFTMDGGLNAYTPSYPIPHERRMRWQLGSPGI